MKNIAVIIGLAFALVWGIRPAQRLAAQAPGQAQASQVVLAIKAARLIDGTGAAPIDNAVVVVVGDKIERVGAAAQVQIPAGARVIDLGQSTLMPGIIDGHAHLSVRPETSGIIGQLEGMTQPDAKQMARIVRDIRVQLLSGVTTLYVVGEVHYNDIYTQEAVDKGNIPGPRIYPSGNFISTTAGHGPAEYRTTNGPWEMRKFVRTNYEAGAHHMKLTITDRARVGPRSGAMFAPGESNYTKEEIDAAVDELHRLGIQATAHANGDSIRLALEAGVDSIQHGGGLTEDLIALFVKKGKGFVNTYTVGYQTVFDEWEYLDTKANNIKEWVEHCRQVIMKARQNPRRDQGVRTRYQQLKQAKDAGVPIGLGTDSMHGLMPLEIANLVDAGFTPMQAIMAATSANAKVLGIDKEVGTIQKGKFADLIAVNGRPDQNVNVLTDIKFIMVGGRDHSSLSFR